MPQVKVIEPIEVRANKLRVAAYARVSSNSEDQLNSFSTQVGYYTEYIQSKDEWEFAGVYADEAVTGTMTDKRDEFQRLLRDCKAGKIDRVIVKSISRFARNTLDCIQTVRELKQRGIAVEFEKEGIDSGNLGGEMLLSVLGSAAQEESLSISKNLKWSYRRRMRSGDFITCKAPLGYCLQGNTLVPDPLEVPIVEYIFASYLSGKGTLEIANDLNNQEAQIFSSTRARWYHTTIRYILGNEKYIGDSLVQKKFTPDELPFQQKRNKGEATQYYIKNTHPAIIPRDIFDIVQKLLNQRAIQRTPKRGNQQTTLSRIMKCGLCGSTFHKHKTKEKNDWSCSQHKTSKTLCAMGIVQENDVFQAFLTLYNKLRNNLDILETMLTQLQEMQSIGFYMRPDIVELNQKILDLIKQNHALTRLQTKGCIDPALFLSKSTRNNQELKKLRNQMNKLREPDSTKQKIENTKLILGLMDGTEPMMQFEPSIFKSMVQSITIYAHKFCFHLINGLSLEEGR